MTNETTIALDEVLRLAIDAENRAQSTAYQATCARYAAELALEVASGRGDSLVAQIARHYIHGEFGPDWEAERTRLIAALDAEKRGSSSAVVAPSGG